MVRGGFRGGGGREKYTEMIHLFLYINFKIIFYITSGNGVGDGGGEYKRKEKMEVKTLT